MFRKVARGLLLTAGVTATIALSGSVHVFAQGMGCGVEPPALKPVPPVGCRDMAHQCICDSMGQNCRWVWVCVKG